MRSISDTQHKQHRITMLCLYAKCRLFIIIMLGVILGHSQMFAWDKRSSLL
jgi:hypothetical protein